MKTLITMIAAIILVAIQAHSQAPDTMWTKTFGGIYTDWGNSVQQTIDGGYIIIGSTYSFGAGGDAWLIKTDAFGDTLWTKTFGGSDSDGGNSVLQTQDNGYIILGYTQSFGAGASDVWLIKTDNSGDTLWTKTFGGMYSDAGASVQQTQDDGFIIVGITESFSNGATDAYFIKTNASGDTLWTKSLGGAFADDAISVQATTDLGYIAVGSTISFGSSVWLIKMDAFGDTLWTKTFGGMFSDGGTSVLQTQDNGYIIVGYTESFGAGQTDVWLIKTDSSGNTLWTKTFGGSNGDIGYSVKETKDSGYIITGSTFSFGAGNNDIWTIKTDNSGDTLWTKTFGGSGVDIGYSVEETADGGYIITGRTQSFGAGAGDVWLIKLETDSPSVVKNYSDLIPEIFCLSQNYPNPFNPSTKINWQVPVGSWQTLKIYDVLGNEVATLIDEYKPTGSYEVEWNASGLPSGVYFYQLKTKGYVETKRWSPSEDLHKSSGSAQGGKSGKIMGMQRIWFKKIPSQFRYTFCFNKI